MKLLVSIVIRFYLAVLLRKLLSPLCFWFALLLLILFHFCSCFYLHCTLLYSTVVYREMCLAKNHWLVLQKRSGGMRGNLISLSTTQV